MPAPAFSVSLPRSRSRKLLGWCFASLIVMLVQVTGCGVGGHTVDQQTIVAPAIISQPADQTVPMGLTATFSVGVSGNPLSYQWSENGTPIVDATSATYTTPATAFADTGATFAVTVSNSLGTASSASASLTVTARAPLPGDLRFQQVDAASTVNGYGNDGGLSSDIPGREGAYFGSSIGSPLFVSPINCNPPPVPAGEGCTWLYEQFNLPSNLGLATGYAGDFFTNFDTDLQSSSFPAAGAPVDSPNSVVTSMDLESSDNLFAVSWIQSSQSTGFDMFQQTVAPSDLQAAATAEGASGRVITAVSYNAGQVVYLSYGWESDTSTVYESQVATASIETAAAVAANLASQGYIITAIGGSDLADSFLIVGTRVQGDTMPRPFVALAATTGAQVAETIMQPGYAIVGLLQDAQGNLTYLGER